MNNRTMMITGWVLTGIYSLFMLGASVTPKFFFTAIANETMTQLGWPMGYVTMIGAIELVCVMLYLYPKTSVFGAVLTMGLLGGAIATQVRAESPLFSHTFFGIYLGLLMWGGLWLRDPALRAILPFRR
jgi:hypothetical protein